MLRAGNGAHLLYGLRSSLPVQSGAVNWLSPTIPGSLALLALASCGDPAPHSGQESPRPDVLLVVVDTLRADRLSAYGYDRPTSPVMEGLIERGVLFEDVTAQASWTLPSMVSMMQGRYVTSYRDIFVEDAPTLAELFRDAGYRTLGVVGNGLLSIESGFDRGFDFYEARSRKIGEGGRTIPAREAAELVSDASKPLLEALRKDDQGSRPPMFAYLHMMDPHGPYRRHPQLDQELPLEQRIESLDMSRQQAEFSSLNPEFAGDAAGEWTGIEHDIARYDQEVRIADDYLGIVLEFLAREGNLENTIVAIVSDHGECLWEHPLPEDSLKGGEGPRGFFFQGHGNLLYQEIIATPMILAGPGLPPGTRVSAPVENVDLLPTLLELCGITDPGTTHGRSLVEVISGGPKPRAEIYSAVLQGRSVREAERGWKLIVPGPHHQSRKTELFDLQADPDELSDLAQAHPEVVERLRARIEAWVEEHPTPTNLGQKKSEGALQDLKALGYATGEDD